MCKRESDGYEGKVEYKQLNEERAQAMRFCVQTFLLVTSDTSQDTIIITSTPVGIQVYKCTRGIYLPFPHIRHSWKVFKY